MSPLMMTMRYSVCILVLFAAQSISISESISSEHSLGGTGGGSQKGDCENKRGDDCNHNTHHNGCYQHSDCHSHCSQQERPFCSYGHCHCRECVYQLDCSNHCNTYQPFYCSSSGNCRCGDSECQYDSQCKHHCRTGQTLVCSQEKCSCIETTTMTTTTSTTTTTPTPTTTTTTTTTPPPPPTTTTTPPTTTEAPTTTSEPTTVNPQLLIKCTNHTECSSHVCPAGKHPYCSFGQRSTDCQCTVCTDDSHCFCPAGLVGKCHFNYFERSHSCVCGFAPDTTTQPKVTTTVKSTTQLLTTHTITNNPNTTQTTVQPSSQRQTTDLPSTAYPSTTPVPPTTAQHGTNTTQQTTLALGMRSCHVCGDNDNGIPCDTRSIYVGNLQQCGPGEDFCMTDLIHNGQPFPTIFKRCVNEEECRNKWLHQTSDLEHCTNYGNVLVEGHYSCHFCCTSDGCNSQQIPEKSTLYIKA